MTTQTTTTAIDIAASGVRGAVANGPADLLDWDTVDWRTTEQQVRRLRQRIFKAVRAKDYKKVRNLQKLMLRSRANTLVSVRQVTERNTGRATAGVDGQVALTPKDRAELALELQRQARPGHTLPVKRVHIPKKGGKRPLGIPVISDRAQQARVKNALEPEWEARLDRRQYGFRPGRGCLDAIGIAYNTLRGDRSKREWALDADLKAAFDHIDHDHLTDRLGTFPARGQVRAWLKAGVVDKNRYSPTTEGTPQGGVISPLLLNIALQGIEQAAGARYYTRGDLAPGTPAVITYADDFVVLCHSRQQAETVRERLGAWLEPKGLVFNQDKTTIVPVTEGLDFLGFNVRRYQTSHGDKLLIRPSKDAINKIKARLATEVRSLRGATPTQLLGRLNPIVRGWAAYYRIGVSSKAFHTLDNYLWRLLYNWALRRHPNKPKRWVKTRYFGRFNEDRQDNWVFGDRQTGAYLHKFSWTPIVRHVVVKGAASLDDPALARYWADRRRKREPPPLATSLARSLRAQRGRCPLCGDTLLDTGGEPESPSEWEQWFTTVRTTLTRQRLVRTNGQPGDHHYRLVHGHCARRQPGGTSSGSGSRRRASTPTGAA